MVCGRIKDVIIVGGRNVYPEEIERAAAGIDGVRAGNVIAFGIEGRRGKEGIVVVAETKAEDPKALRDSVVDGVCAAVGIPPLEVVLVRPGSLPKTSSGKLQRSLCKDQYRRGRPPGPVAAPNPCVPTRPPRPAPGLPRGSECQPPQCWPGPPAGNTMDIAEPTDAPTVVGLARRTGRAPIRRRSNMGPTTNGRTASGQTTSGMTANEATANETVERSGSSSPSSCS